MQWPTQSQFNTAFRYSSGYAATAGAVLVTIGVLPADTVHALVDAIQKVITDLQQLVHDSHDLIVLAFPIAMAVIAKLGWNSARTANQKQSVVAAQPNTVIVETPSPTAALAAASAIAAIPAVSKVVATAAVADATPSNKVVAK